MPQNRKPDHEVASAHARQNVQVFRSSTIEPKELTMTTSPSPVAGGRLQAGSLVLLPERRLAAYEDRTVELTPKQFRLLAGVVQGAGRIVPASRLGLRGGLASVLRNRLAAIEPDERPLVISVQGRGYALDLPEDDRPRRWGYELDAEQRELRIEGRPRAVSADTCRLLRLFFDNPARSFARDDLLAVLPDDAALDQILTEHADVIEQAVGGRWRLAVERLNPEVLRHGPILADPDTGYATVGSRVVSLRPREIALLTGLLHAPSHTLRLGRVNPTTRRTWLALLRSALAPEAQIVLSANGGYRLEVAPHRSRSLRDRPPTADVLHLDDLSLDVRARVVQVHLADGLSPAVLDTLKRLWDAPGRRLPSRARTRAALTDLRHAVGAHVIVHERGTGYAAGAWLDAATRLGLDEEAGSAWCEMALSPNETTALACLMRAAGQAVAYAAFNAVGISTVSSTVWALRARLGDTAEPPRLVVRVADRGYRLKRPGDAMRRVGDLAFEVDGQQATWQGRAVSVPGRQMTMLLGLMGGAGRLVRHEDLTGPGLRTPRERAHCAGQLRKRLGTLTGLGADVLVGMTGVGWRLDVPAGDRLRYWGLELDPAAEELRIAGVPHPTWPNVAAVVGRLIGAHGLPVDVDDLVACLRGQDQAPATLEAVGAELRRIAGPRLVVREAGTWRLNLRSLNPSLLEQGRLKLDPDTGMATVGERVIVLRPSESALVAALIGAHGAALSRRELTERLGTACGQLVVQVRHALGDGVRVHSLPRGRIVLVTDADDRRWTHRAGELLLDAELPLIRHRDRELVPLDGAARLLAALMPAAGRAVPAHDLVAAFAGGLRAVRKAVIGARTLLEELDAPWSIPSEPPDAYRLEPSEGALAPPR